MWHMNLSCVWVSLQGHSFWRYCCWRNIFELTIPNCLRFGITCVYICNRTGNHHTSSEILGHYFIKICLIDGLVDGEGEFSRELSYTNFYEITWNIKHTTKTRRQQIFDTEILPVPTMGVSLLQIAKRAPNFNILTVKNWQKP